MVPYSRIRNKSCQIHNTANHSPAASTAACCLPWDWTSWACRTSVPQRCGGPAGCEHRTRGRRAAAGSAPPPPHPSSPPHHSPRSHPPSRYSSPFVTKNAINIFYCVKYSFMTDCRYHKQQMVFLCCFNRHKYGRIRIKDKSRFGRSLKFKKANLKSNLFC